MVLKGKVNSLRDKWNCRGGSKAVRYIGHNCFWPSLFSRLYWEELTREGSKQMATGLPGTSFCIRNSWLVEMFPSAWHMGRHPTDGWNESGMEESTCLVGKWLRWKSHVGMLTDLIFLFFPNHKQFGFAY